MEIQIQIELRELAPGRSMETVNARELWAALESKQQFTDWLFNRIDKFKLVPDEDYLIHKVMKQITGKAGSTRNVISPEYFLTIDTAKELAMVENNDRGKQVRKYFIECERLAKAAALAQAVQPPAPRESSFDMANLENPEFLIGLLTTYAHQNKALKTTIAEQAPKVEALKRIATVTQGSLCIRDTAKALQVGEKVLFHWLEQNDWIYRRSGSPYIAYSPRIKQGYLEHKVTTVEARNGEDKLAQQVRVTPAGLAYLAEAFSKLADTPTETTKPVASN